MSDSPVTLITGGGSGIGAATARAMLDLGHRVAVTGRGEARLRRFAEELGEPAGLLTLPGDAADHDAVRSAVETTLGEFGRLDNAVANAGYATFDSLDDGDPAGWRDMVLTNVLGPALLIRAALPALKETRGRIVRRPAGPRHADRRPARRRDRLGDLPARRSRRQHHDHPPGRLSPVSATGGGSRFIPSADVPGQAAISMIRGARRVLAPKGCQLRLRGHGGR